MSRGYANRNRELKNARILVVEDNPDQSLLIRNAIQQNFPGAHISQVNNPEQALKYLKAAEDCIQDIPQLIILDLYLPERENGWAALESIRKLPGVLGLIPIVMLSSSDFPDDIREAYERGSSCYLVKPLLLDQWQESFKVLREYWWDTVSLPSARYHVF
ncbi:response regulator [Larkinella harenae]